MIDQSQRLMTTEELLAIPDDGISRELIRGHLREYETQESEAMIAMLDQSQRLMTTEELLAIPDDGISRELIRGHLREYDMTRRNRRHSRTVSRLSHLLELWLEGLPAPSGEILAGDAGVRLLRDPDTTVGVDVAYISAVTAAATPEGAFLIDAPPVLAVEVLSPSDRQNDVLDKVEDYLRAGVKLVWVVEPVFRTVCVYQSDDEPRLFNVRDELNGDPHMPGLRIPVARIFGR